MAMPGSIRHGFPTPLKISYATISGRWRMALPAAAFVFALLISAIFLSTLPFCLNDVVASIVTGGR
jgi:hypothetical protein